VIAGCAVLLLFLQRSYLPDGGFAAALALVAAAVVWRPGTGGAVALGVATGVGVMLTAQGLILLGGGLIASYDTSYATRVGSLLAAAAMLAFGLAESGRRGTLAFRRPDPYSGGLLGIGFAALLVPQLLNAPGGSSRVYDSKGWALLVPLVAAALVLLAVSLVNATGYLVATAAAATYLVSYATVSLINTRTDSGSSYDTGMVVGHLILLAALVPSLIRQGQALRVA